MPRLEFRLILLTLSLALMLSACEERSGDENLPTPAKALGCPDLTGTYALPNAKPELDPRRWLSDARNLSWQSFSLQAVVPGSPVYVSLHREQTELEREIEQFREQRPKAYKRWREKASLSYVERGVTRRAHYDALAELGPTPEIGFSTDSGICLDSWFRYPADAHPHEDQRAFALDQDGNLLIQVTETTRDEFPIWCGDGCKGIPYAWHTRVSWTRAKRIAAPKPWVWTRDLTETQEEPPGDPSGHEDQDPRVNPLRQRVFAALPKGSTMFNFYKRSGGVIFSGTCPTPADLETIKRFLQRDSSVAEVIERRVWETNRGEINFALEIPLKDP